MTMNSEDAYIEGLRDGATLPDQQFPEAPFTGAIILCPVCSTPIDAEKWGTQVHTCLSCETTFAVILDPGKVAAHAIIG
jgi:hypothetical protein